MGISLYPNWFDSFPPSYATELNNYFDSRLTGLIEDDVSGDGESAYETELKRLTEMGLDPLETYIELIVASRSGVHRPNIVTCIDFLLMKNTDSGLLRQSRAKGAPRRFILGSRLLEVLLQIAVIMPQGASFATRELRVDELLGVSENATGFT